MYKQVRPCPICRAELPTVGRVEVVDTAMVDCLNVRGVDPIGPAPRR
jgi:hypothetical protein